MAVTSISAYPRLQKALETNQKIVYLCGAGASMSLGEHRLSWTNWILAGKGFLSPPECDELDRRIGAWSTDELIDAATFLLERLKAVGAYDTFMERTIGSLHPLNTTFSDALRTVWRAGDMITTTNYDLLIERSVNASAVSYSSPAEILSVIRSEQDNKVIHLHGVFDRDNGMDDIVADDPQYQGILADSGAQFIQNLIGTHTIMIVGCGGTVDDPNLSGFMNFLVEKLGVTDIPYFYLMKNGDTVPSLPQNAVPISYGDDYSDLPVFLSEMACMRMRKRVGSSKLISVNPYASGSASVSAFARMHFSSGFSQFVGRTDDISELNHFLDQGAHISWWSVVGEGGIGKSRLILEWLRNMPAHWFGFFTRKDAEEAERFIPFTDTVVVFDYVLGNAHECAETLSVYLRSFSTSPYKLRVLFCERAQDTEDWLQTIRNDLEPEDRLLFEAGSYQPPHVVTELSIDDEKQLIGSYLSAYLPLAESNRFIEDCKADIHTVSEAIEGVFRASVEPTCYRPLYLNVFIEVWLEKEGSLSVSSSEELLTEFLNKERRRWKVILGDDALVDSYLRLLALACAIERFNITDVYGDNYLKEDCERLIEFFDHNSRRPGAKNEIADLFVTMDELVDSDGEPAIAEVFMDPDASRGTLDEDSLARIRSLEADERFAFSAPYIKLDADPTEVYLQMLVDAGIADDDEKQQLEAVRQAVIEKTRSLPDHAWIIEPVLPTIIKEFIVSYVVNERDAVRFTKLARSNSVLGLQGFLTLAVEDKPDNQKFQRMIVTPPDEVLNYFEYYLSLLIRVGCVNDFKTVELSMINVDPCFCKYEFDLWRRIVHVLIGREDVQLIFDSGCRFIEYIESLDGYVRTKDEAADIIREYCVGLYNAGDFDKLNEFILRLTSVDRLFPKNERFGSSLCECSSLLIHLKLYLDADADITEEWSRLRDVLLTYDAADDKVKMAMEAAYRYAHQIIDKEELDALGALECGLEELLEKHCVTEVAEVAALTAANIFTLSIKHRYTVLSDEYEKIKRYYAGFSHSKTIRSAFVFAAKEYYSESSGNKRVPEKLLKKAQKWANQHPDEIEFREGCFGLLLANLEYARAHSGRGEQIRIFREMKRLAETTDYSEYHEENDMVETIKTIQEYYGY